MPPQPPPRALPPRIERAFEGSRHQSRFLADAFEAALPFVRHRFAEPRLRANVVPSAPPLATKPRAQGG